jgi:Ribonuclease G/E
MSEPAWLIDAAIGETRAVQFENGLPLAIRVRRDPLLCNALRFGEVYTARLVSKDRARRLAFVDCGPGRPEAFLALDMKGEARRAVGGARAVREGELICVRIAREAVRGKAAIAELLDQPAGETPRRMARAADDVALDGAKPADPDTRAKIDAAIEEALTQIAPIPGGGRLIIEPTAALVAIDVDAGERAGGQDSAQFSLALNRAAGAEALRQLRLRGLGGLFAIDFPTMSGQKAADTLLADLKQHAARDPWGMQLAPLSRFGVVEGARGQLNTPLHEVLCDVGGQASVITAALAALRAIEREGAARRGDTLQADVATEVAAWLDTCPLDWRAALNDRLGARWTLHAKADLARDQCHVRAL